MVKTWRVWSRPKISAEWGKEYESRSDEWWETFLDLIFVSAFANGADGLKTALHDDESAVAQAAIDFVAQFSLFYSAWLHYTLFTSRYIDTSLAHSALMFLHFVGTSGMVVNTGSGDSRTGFSIGAVIQRAAVILMHIGIFIRLPRARRQAIADLLHTVPAAIAIAIALLCRVSNGTLQSVLAVAAVYEMSFPFVQTWAHALSRDSVPLNIDHMQSRLGSYTMLVLGESVVSAVISHHAMAHKSTPYYTGMTLSLAINFAIALVYFTIAPPRKFSALRRSAFAGIGLMTAHWALGIALLSMSVGVKLLVTVIVDHEEQLLKPSWYLITMSSLGGTMGVMLVLRLLHWWGRQPAPGDSPPVRRAKYLWWAGLVIATPLPPIVAGITLCVWNEGVDPFNALWQALGCVYGFVIFESVLVHWLDALGHHRFTQNLSPAQDPLLSVPIPMGATPSETIPVHSDDET